MPNVFVSYHRKDGIHPLLLCQELVQAFEEGQVFWDKKSVQLGEKFWEVIHEGVSSCEILIAVIGERWLGALREGARPDSPRNYAQREVALALEQEGIRVIPVLVGNAHMPSALQLPKGLEKLAGRNEHRIRDESWEDDVSTLIESLKDFGVPTRTQTGDESRASRRRTKGLVAGVASVTLSVALLLLAGWNANKGRNDLDEAPLRIEAESILFPEQQVGSTSRAQEVKIANPSDFEAELKTLTIHSDAADEFQILKDDCSESSLGPKETCTIQITFAPRSATRRTAILSLEEVGQVSLEGEGIEPEAPPPRIANIPAASSFPVGLYSRSEAIAASLEKAGFRTEHKSPGDDLVEECIVLQWSMPAALASHVIALVNQSIKVRYILYDKSDSHSVTLHGTFVGCPKKWAAGFRPVTQDDIRRLIGLDGLEFQEMVREFKP